MRLENNITSHDVRLFIKLVESKGFEYALSNFLLDVFDYSEFSIEVNNVIWNEIERLKTLTFSEYNQRKLNYEIVNLCSSEKVPFNYKLLLIYQIITKTIENKNLEIAVEDLLADLLDNLFNYPLSKDQLQLNVLLRVFNERVMFEKDEIKQELVLKTFIRTLSRYDYIVENSIISKFLSIMSVFIYGFINFEESIDTKFKERFGKLLKKQYNNDLTGDSTSLQKLIAKNFDILADIFPYKVHDLVLDSFDLGYKPDKKVYARTVYFSDSLISDLRFAFQVLSSKYEFVLGDFVNLSETDQYRLKIALDRFVSSFRVDDLDIPYLDDKIKDVVSKVSALFGVFNNDFIPLNQVFEEANNRLSILNDTVPVVHINNTVENLDNFYKNDEKTSFEVSVNNLNIFGASESLEGSIKDLLHLNFGVNDTREISNNVLAGFMDSQSLSVALEILFKNHLKKIEVKTSDFNLEMILDLIVKYEIDKYNLLSYYDYKNHNILKLDENFKSLYHEKRNINGLPNVFISSSKFKFSFKSTIVNRHSLTDDDVTELLSNKFRVSNGLYKINNVYLPFEKAFDIVKKNFTRDVFIFRYVFEATEDSGFYFVFK